MTELRGPPAIPRGTKATAALPAYMAGKRDLRIDLLRGVAIVAMVVDHVGGDESWLYALTGGNRFYVSAAEAFLFLSGLVTGIVYSGVATRQGLGPAIVKMLRRAAVLYAWTVGLTLALPVLARLLDLGWEDPFHDGAPVAYVVSVLTLHRTYFLADILLVYVLLFILAGLALALITEGRTAIVAGLSWGAWLAWQLWPQYANLPWTIQGMDVFNLGPWQALFFTGLVIGAHRKRLARQLSRVSLWAYVLVGSIGLATAIGLYKYELQAFLFAAPRLNAQSLTDELFSKSDLRIGRLLVFGFLSAFAFSGLTLGWRRIEPLFGWLFVPLGQHSLTAYALHLGIVAGLSKLGLAVFGEDGRGMTQNMLLQVTGIVAVWFAIEAIISFQARWARRGSSFRLGARKPPPLPVPPVERRQETVPHAA